MFCIWEDCGWILIRAVLFHFSNETRIFALDCNGFGLECFCFKPYSNIHINDSDCRSVAIRWVVLLAARSTGDLPSTVDITDKFPQNANMGQIDFPICFLECKMFPVFQKPAGSYKRHSG